MNVKDIPGVQIYQSKLSEHYFFGIELKKDKQCIVNVFKFLFPVLTEEQESGLLNSELDDAPGLELPVNNEKVFVAYGSFLMMNMFGTAVQVTPSTLKSMFKLVTNVNETIQTRTFKCTVVLNVFRFNDKIMGLESNNVFCDVIWQTYKDYPSKAELLESIKTGDLKQYFQSVEAAGYTVMADILGIQELSIVQKNEYLKK